MFNINSELANGKMTHRDIIFYRIIIFYIQQLFIGGLGTRDRKRKKKKKKKKKKKDKVILQQLLSKEISLSHYLDI